MSKTIGKNDKLIKGITTIIKVIKQGGFYV